jgi:hypothetical protein
MTATDRPAWLNRRRRSTAQRDIDDVLIRQVVGYASRFADAAGHRLDAYDVLEALDDTGLMLIRDGEGFAADARRWAVMVIAQDPLDLEPAVDSHFDREQEDRDAAGLRGRRHRFEEDE